MIIVVEVDFESCANSSLAKVGYKIPQLFLGGTEPVSAANKYILNMSRRLAPKSMRTIVEHIRELHLWMEGSNLVLDMMTSHMFDAYIDALCIYKKKNGDPLSWNTISSRVAGAYRYLVWCGDHDYSPSLSRAAATNSYKSSRSRYQAQGHPAKSLKELTRFLDLHDAVRFIDSLATVSGRRNDSVSRRNKLIGALMLQSGLRVSEVVNFPVFDLPEINNRGHSTPARVVGKGNKPRVILLPNNLLVKLWQYVDIDREKILDGTSHGNPDDYKFLFLTESGTRVTANWVEKLFATTSAQLGLKTTPHTLRHTYGTYHYLLNRDLGGLANLMGHASEETTRAYYVNTAVLVSYAGSYGALQEEIDKLIEV